VRCVFTIWGLTLALVPLPQPSSRKVNQTSQATLASHSLFNGKDLDGWRQAGPGRFVVVDGMLKTEGGMGLLWYTRSKIGYAKLRVVFRLTAKDSDSGVFIRIPEEPSEPWMPVNRGYEVEIGDWPDDYSCTGVLYVYESAGSSDQADRRVEYAGYYD